MSVCTATGIVLLFGTGIVVSIEACPSSSERVFTSNPSWMQLVENIWRRAWKWTDGNFPFLRILAKRYCNVRGSIGFSFPDTRKAEPLLICFCRISAIYSGIGMVLLELSVLGSVRINFVFANPFTHWIRWMVFFDGQNPFFQINIFPLQSTQFSNANSSLPRQEERSRTRGLQSLSLRSIRSLKRSKRFWRIKSVCNGLLPR